MNQNYLQIQKARDMVKKSKKIKVKRTEPSWLLIVITLSIATFAFLQNPNGQFSDILGFYGIHFFDGQHDWPFSKHEIEGFPGVVNPVEYPALTGLIMWLISFFVTQGIQAQMNYYLITAIFQGVLFCLVVLQIKKLTNNKFAYFFALSPAVAYSLYRNWDIWAIITMIYAIMLFEKKRFNQSAIILAVSIATKFFPVVLLIPIIVIFIKQKQYKILNNYILICLVSWMVINLPFILKDFSGWAFFYKFSFERNLGTGSVYELGMILTPSFKIENYHYYILNILIFLIFIAFLIKMPTSVQLSQVAFISIFVFTLFNKQYSMQYVIWLTATAVIFMFNTLKSQRIIILFALWQICEFLFQFLFFQNILTNVSKKGSIVEVTFETSNELYAYSMAIRYLILLLFTFSLCHNLSRNLEAK